MVHPAAPAPWRFRDGSLDLSLPRIMGVVNVTPDSFSDGGTCFDPAAACGRVRSLIRDGADLLDVGGESTRPGADPVSADEEQSRVIPVVREAVGFGIPVSVDTSKAPVARAALEAGAAIVNDVSALSDPDMGPLVAETGAGLVLMHRRGTPKTMQESPSYRDLLAEIVAYLLERRGRAEDLGIPRDRMVLDPGIGFGKKLEHNLELLSRLDELAALGSPLLLGVSRKSFIGSLTGVSDPRDRGPGSLAAALAARSRGAVIFRVHDVAATRQAMNVFEAIGHAGR